MEVHSRSYLLVQKELNILQEHTEIVQLVHVELPTRILCLIFPRSSEGDWKDGKFYINIYFPQQFNFKPPSLRFLTVPFHPNVDPVHGECYLPKLLQWNSNFNIIDVIENLLDVLSKPIINDERNFVANKEAKDLMLYNPKLYSELVTQCVTNSLKLGDLMMSKGYVGKYDLRYAKERVKAFRTKSDIILKSQSGRVDEKGLVRQVGFEDYQQMWTQIGTTKSSGSRLDTKKTTPSKQRLSSVPKLFDIVTKNSNTAFEAQTHNPVQSVIKMKLETALSPVENDIDDEVFNDKGRPPAFATVGPTRPASNVTTVSFKLTPPFISKDVIGLVPIPDYEEQGTPESIESPKLFVKTDFSSQMPSLPSSRENNLKFHKKYNSTIGNRQPSPIEQEGDDLLKWTSGFNARTAGIL